MEVLKLSKFKLQLRALVTEVRDLRERERSATEQLHALIQKQKQNDEDHVRKLQELQAELASTAEMRQKIERKMNHLRDDNTLLENRQKELKATIQTLLQSRDDFINAYQESTCEMRRSIETRDRKLSLLSEKLNSHIMLFDSIEKEALSIKQVMDNVKGLISHKEELVSSLKSKVNEVCAYEKLFKEKINYLENKVKNDEEELKRKDGIIAQLEEQLEAAKVSNGRQSQMEDLRKALFEKDVVIQNLVTEKKALLLEVEGLAIVLQKIQDTIQIMNEEDKTKFSSIVERKENFGMVTSNENTGNEGDVQMTDSRSAIEGCREGAAANSESSCCEKHYSYWNLLQEDNHLNSRTFEFACSPTKSACSEPQSADHARNMSIHDEKDNHRTFSHLLESECSTTQAEASEGAKL
ncbi:polyamine-modulated factor 1-binding protein 1 isoform X2 [Rhodamnia argentea]|uniref:Polyamine-modulated factor 1-binding protein 1 isoform X2 n=1 Tax=Rhodamnia argentea TaxID=178133 RepID=A0A8B8R4F2_9MYRT|nr:polyamine-modulated factor 1-binding protein 1 isoform X2 [Rhodamnia argentea]